MRRAAEANQYLFAFFYEKDDEATRAARKTFDAAVKKITPAPQVVAVDRTAAGEKEIVAKFGVDRAPMPLVLAIAPNGAVTGGFKAAELTEERLRDAVASPGLQQCLKALQERQAGAGVPAERQDQRQRRGHERGERVQGGSAVCGDDRDCEGGPQRPEGSEAAGATEG